MAPGSGGQEPVALNILLDTVSGVISISEGLIARLQQGHPGEILVKSFQGTVCVPTSFGKAVATTQWTVPFLLMLLTPWGRKVRFRLPFVVRPGPCGLSIVGRMTKRSIREKDGNWCGRGDDDKVAQ